MGADSHARRGMSGGIRLTWQGTSGELPPTLSGYPPPTRGRMACYYFVTRPQSRINTARNAVCIAVDNLSIAPLGVDTLRRNPHKCWKSWGNGVVTVALWTSCPLIGRGTECGSGNLPDPMECRSPTLHRARNRIARVECPAIQDGQRSTDGGPSVLPTPSGGVGYTG